MAWVSSEHLGDSEEFGDVLSVSCILQKQWIQVDADMSFILIFPYYTDFFVLYWFFNVIKCELNWFFHESLFLPHVKEFYIVFWFLKAVTDFCSWVILIFYPNSMAGLLMMSSTSTSVFMKFQVVTTPETEELIQRHHVFVLIFASHSHLKCII